jgi:hypothetical protein
MPAKKITEDNLPTVLSILDTWKGKLTWPLYTKAVKEKLGLAKLHQSALQKYRVVQDEFTKRQAEIRNIGDQGQPSEGATIELLRGQVDELRMKLNRVTRQRDAFKEMFIRWQYNIHRMPGFDPTKIDLKIPGNPIDQALPPKKDGAK